MCESKRWKFIKLISITRVSKSQPGCERNEGMIIHKVDCKFIKEIFASES